MTFFVVTKYRDQLLTVECLWPGWDLLSGVTESREVAGVYYLQFPGWKVVEKYCSPGPVQSLAEILVLWVCLVKFLLIAYDNVFKTKYALAICSCYLSVPFIG